MSVCAVFLAALGVQVVAITASADPVATCSQNGATLTVNGNGGSVDVSRTEAGDLEFDSQPCGTVTTVDTVNISGLPTTPGVGVLFDMLHGLFAPGATPEAGGSSEIEFNVTANQFVDQIYVDGRVGDDEITVGGRLVAFVTDLNLDGLEDGDHPDADVTIQGAPSLVRLRGRGGNDTLSGRGIGTSHSFATSDSLLLQGGDGQDILQGGIGDDELIAPDDTALAPDVFSGGAGFDEVSYLGAPVDLSLSPDGVANDGEQCPGLSCEGDDIGTDVESLVGGNANDTLIGGPGDQVLDGWTGNNTLRGGPGNDFLSAGDGADDFGGGPGVDVVSYAKFHFTDGVRASLDGVANDGSPGEDDHIRGDVEGLIGSTLGDTLIGNDGPNHLSGGLGDDTLRGLGGKDALAGGNERLDVAVPTPNDGSDTFFGGPGVDTVLETDHSGGVTLSLDDQANDSLTSGASEGVDNIHSDVENLVGGAFGDSLTGDGLANRLTGGRGGDVLRGLAGNDRLIGGRGNDSLNGGPDVDTCKQGPGTGPKVACEH